jgi:hypothetical protein
MADWGTRFSTPEGQAAIANRAAMLNAQFELPGVPTFDLAAMMEASRGDPLSGKRKRKGRAASILTGDEGAGLPTTATKLLLGE